MVNTSQPKKSKIHHIVVNEVHRNVSQELIEITADKLELILNQHIDSLEKSKEWQTPLSLIATIVLVLSTADFKYSLGVPANTWLAIFMIVLGLSVFWLLKTIVKNKKAMSINEILKAIKNQT